VRHLLAKLKPTLRTAIITYYSMPNSREALVSLATRLETARKRKPTYASYKRDANDY